MTAAARAIVWSEGGDPPWLAERTRRALLPTGLATHEVRGQEALASLLRSTPGPVWLMRAGAWPVTSAFEAPPASATGRPLLALGAVHGEAEGAASWRGASDLERGALPAAFSVWLEAALGTPLAASLPAHLGDGLGPGIARLREAGRPRVVRASVLDVHHDRRLRVAEVVTSLQQGGAERIALDLAAALPALGVVGLLAVLGAPTREAFAPSPGLALLDWERPPDRDRRAAHLGEALAAAGIDVAHAHLLEADDVRVLAPAGIPLALTLHNQRPGWPVGTEALTVKDAHLLIACSRAVERDARAAGLSLPRRTVWNGIDFARFAVRAAGPAEDWRARLGFRQDDFVILAVANPRPQKRLERLPAILQALRAALLEAGPRREARLVVAGSTSARSPEAARAASALRDEVERLGLAEHVRLVGAVSDVAPLLRAADALVSTSAHEGLSLAQLEALASDLPVVATAVGGAPEVAERLPGITLVPPDATSAEFVPALRAIAAARERPALAAAASAEFGLRRMAAHHARLLRSVARAATARPREGLLLVTNNFSTGGAQSSARRLLLELHRRGVRVRAAVIQEQPAYPTPGRGALEAAGVPVLSVPPPEDLEPDAAVARILDAVEMDPPQAVVFWNAIAEHKVRLADALFDLPVFDVSPGEMYFASLERYFAHPRPGLPYATPADYGARLAGVIVKYAAEAATARDLLHAPVHVIPNGVEAQASISRALGNGQVTIGTLARLDPRKRLDRLLHALRLAAPGLPPHRLRIAGGAEPGAAGHADELRRLAEGLEVEFVGEVEPRAFLSGLDVFALVAEPAGCPNASLEAMALGIPVVATDAGGMREQIVDGVSGRLVPREDTQALARALVEVCGDGQARRSLAERGRERVLERFSLRVMADCYLDVLLGTGS